MKQLLNNLKPYFLMILIMVIFVMGQTVVNLTLPEYTSKIVNEGIVMNDNGAILRNGLIMLLYAIAGAGLAVMVSYFAAKISTGYVRNLRRAVFMHVERFSLNEFDKLSTSSLITRTTNDMQQVQNVFSMTMRFAIMSPFMCIGSIVKSYQLAPSMSWTVFLSLGVVVVLFVVLFSLVAPKFKLVQALVDKLGLKIKEMITGVRVIRAYNNDALEENKFDKINLESTRINVFVNRIMSLMNPMMVAIMGLASMLVVWVGAYQVNNGNIMIGDLLALMQYIMHTIISFMMISMVFIMAPRAVVSLKRIGEVLDLEPEISDPKKPIKFKKDTLGCIEFKNVEFKYKGSDEPVLHDISFKAEPGQTTAIIGGTGSGKSSILKLIPRLYDVSDGSIEIDGIDIRDVSQTDLRSKIGYVPQQASLFSGTVSSNVSYGNSQASIDELRRAIKIAQAEEFVNDLAEELDHPIAQSGSNVSGGQKQRLSIARALAKSPVIYLFDDSFSALDFKTDAALRKALGKEVAKSTFIVVAQRISTIMQAEKIIVLDEGKIVCIGKHAELMKNCRVYREIAESQLSSSELETDNAK